MTDNFEKIKLQPDIPIDTSAPDPFESDTLGFKDSTLRIVSLLKYICTPFTLGIYGDWGTGKTSFMKLISRLLEEGDDSEVYWFNAWEYENETTLLLPLLHKLSNDSKGKAEDVFKSLKKTATSVILTSSDIALKAVTLNTTSIEEVGKIPHITPHKVGLNESFASFHLPSIYMFYPLHMK